jgi:hypothetical protein
MAKARHYRNGRSRNRPNRGRWISNQTLYAKPWTPWDPTANFDPARVEFGFKEFWPDAASKYKPFFRHIKVFEDAMNRLVNKGRSDVDTYPHGWRVIHTLVETVFVGMTSVVTLVGNGQGPDAFKVARSALENAINAEYLRLYPDEVDNYLEWKFVEDHKKLESIRQYRPASLAGFTKDQLDKVDNEYDRVKDRFRNTSTSKCESCGHERNRVNKWNCWTVKNLAERAELTATDSLYRASMRLMNEVMHGSISGIMQYFGSEDPDRIAVPPHDSECATMALVAAHESLLRAIRTLTQVYNEDSTPPYDDLLKEFVSVWEKILGIKAEPLPAVMAAKALGGV